MKFSTREDIEAPIEYVFSVFSDFDTLERHLCGRGAQISQKEVFFHPDAQQGWEASFRYNGRWRTVSSELIVFEPPTTMQFATAARGLDGIGVVEFIALSPRRTRALLSLEIRPNSIAGRLTVQSLKMVKNRITRAYKRGVAEYARRLEARYRKDN